MKLPPTSPALIVILPVFIGILHLYATAFFAIGDRLLNSDSDRGILDRSDSFLALGSRVFLTPLGEYVPTDEFGLPLNPRVVPLNSLLVGATLTTVLVWIRARRAREAVAKTGALALVAVLMSAPAFAIQDTRESTVGIPARITDFVLPGSEIEVVPQTAKSAVVLRITRVAPHGTEFRYDIEWTGLDPGEHDLREFLRRKDGTDASSLPAVPVTVRSVLPPGQVVPHHPPAGDVPGFGGYRVWWIVGGIAWTIGLAWILLGFRRQRQRDAAVVTPPRTLAERLRPLVERALDGRLSRTERAQLELGLVAYWRRKLGLDEHQPAEAHEILRGHAAAGPLLNQLDAWLHKPGVRQDVDVAALLAPYKDLPPDAIDVPDLVARRA